MIEVSAVRVLVIDNTISFRDALADGLRQSLPLGSLVEKTSEPVDALEKVTLFHPDVIVLNYAMSPLHINGQYFIHLLAEQQEIPIVAYGLLPREKISLRRFRLTDYLVKPSDDGDHLPFFREVAKHIEGVQGASAHGIQSTKPAHFSEGTSGVRLRPGTVMTRDSWKQQRKSSFLSTAPAHRPREEGVPTDSTERKKIDLIAIGSSTGGTEALSAILKNLRPPLPGIVITQHIPALFAKLFAQRLDAECKIHVKEAVDGELVQRNTAYIAPGNLHMTVHRNGDAIFISCGMGPKVHSCRPSVDVLFKSVAANIGSSAAGVILTGMGHDGAEGLLAMRKAGSPTIGQDKDTCVVYGMPRAAWEMGAVERQLPLGSIASAITQLAFGR